MKHSPNFHPSSIEWRFERFAELRARNPEMDHEQVFDRMHEEEIDELTSIEDARIASEMGA